MSNRADVLFAQTTGLVQFNGGGTQYIVQTPTGVLYIVYIDSGSDVAFRKSTDGGFSWSNPVIVFTGTATAVSIWYDRWSDISAGLIHIAYTESATDDTLYRNINTESADALSTQRVIFAGATTATGGHLSITRAKGGNVYCKTVIDAGTEGGFYRLLNANVPSGAWDAARTVDEAIATTDMMILLPDLTAADTQDIIGIFWDASANEISRKLYDDSANTWSETSIAASMTDQAATVAFPHFSACVDVANSQIYLVAWSAVDTLNADLRFWTITNSSITEGTNVVLNSTDDQGLSAIGLETQTGSIYVYYAGASNGSETFLTSVNIYCKGSTDGGTTWSPETKLTLSPYDITWLITTPSFIGQRIVAYHNDIALDEIQVNVNMTLPRANFQLGI
jgi:hypothetical protein